MVRQVRRTARPQAQPPLGVAARQVASLGLVPPGGRRTGRQAPDAGGGIEDVAVVLRGALQGALGPQVEECAIGQAGEVVVERLVLAPRGDPGVALDAEQGQDDERGEGERV